MRLSVPPDDPRNVTLAVLAGGAGTRMGGPKAWLKVAGRPILDHLLDAFDWPGPTLLVTAPGLEHPPGHARFAAEATDPVAGEGPLRGILTALQTARPARYLLVTTVDMPCVRRDQLLGLLDFLARRPAAVGALPVRDDGGRERVEPFPCAVSCAATAAVADRLAQGRRAVHSLLPDVFVPAPVPADWPADVWTNLNYPDELRAYTARVAPPSRP